MGRKKRHRHRNGAPASQGTASDDNELADGMIVAHGDQWQDYEGKLHPCVGTIGLAYRKGSQPKIIRPARPMMSQRHMEFVQLVEMADFTLPHQFRNWRRFFLDEKNFLDEAEHWLSLRLQGRHARIEDDVDKGLMRQTGRTSYTPSRGWSDDDDYWTAWSGWGGTRQNDWWSKKLPLTPKIPAPSGLSGAELMAM